MKTLLLVACLLAAGGGDREQGLSLYRDGKFAEAAAAFRAAIEHEGDAADLQWNLALASWRAGDLAAAETAAEKYAALAKDARPDLHRGLLGAVRFAEAQQLEGEADAMQHGATVPGGGAAVPPPAAGAPPAAPPDPLPLLERALDKAKQAKEHFVAGAAAKATPELLRNTERALRYQGELQKKIDELKKEREQQKKDDKQQDDNKDQQDKKDDKQSDKDDKQDGKQDKPQDQKDQQDGKQDQQDQKDQQGDQGEQKPGDAQQPPEPKPKPEESPQDGKPEGEPKQQDEPKPEPAHPDPKDAKDQQQAQPRSDAPGETVEGKELTPEQQQRLLEQLKQLDGKLQQLRQGSKTGRRPVGRDW